jgi:DNA-binding transcriptional LysR family regulator
MAVLRNPELPHLGTFVKVAELGGFTAAAMDLGVTQAAVSQRISLLERRLQIALFERRVGRTCLTAAGRRLYEYGRKIVDLHQQASEALGGVHSPISGELSVAASSVPGECILPALLPAFQEKFPHVHVRATVSDSGSVLKDIEKGHVALGLVGQEVASPNLDSRQIGSDRLVLIMSSKHDWAARRAITLRALGREQLIIRESGSASRCVLERGLERAGSSLAAMNVTLELGSNSAIKDAVRRGVGVAFLSKLAVQRELDSGELRTVTVKELDLTRHFYVVFDRRRPLPAAAAVFVHFLETQSHSAN